MTVVQRNQLTSIRILQGMLSG